MLIKRNDINTFKKTLTELDFSLNKSENPEIVFLNNIPHNLHPKHYIALEFAEIFEADAVYFRYYDDNRFCTPQIYFYDNSIIERNKLEIAEIHRRVYSSCQVPLICVIDKTQISLYDCRMPVKEKSIGEISNESSLFDRVNLTNINNIKKYFSAKQLKHGIFWESDKASNSFLNNQSAYEKLVTVLTNIKDGFIKEFISHNVPKEFAEELLFKCILIKYLEENGKNGNINYSKEFYHKSGINYNTLEEILSNNQILKLLDSLEHHFNGNVFAIEGKNEFEIKNKRTLLKKLDLTILANHLEGKLDLKNQISIWNIYSFKDIPIELISNFYEEFIPKTDENKGTVYTPSFLVNLLIDECLPLSNNIADKNYNIKLIDVSCGSGIFISSAFKRLVQRYRVNKGKDGKPLEKDKIKLVNIKRILSTNIYGIDKNSTAVKLTKFSLQLALCQIVPQNELWNWSEEKVFDNLTDNIFEKDYFNFLTDEKNSQFIGSFDWVIGNPPFKKLNPNEFAEIEIGLTDSKFQLSKATNTKKQLALTFLETVVQLSKKNTGKVCQIIPSGELLYFNDSDTFRNYFFSKYNVSQIIDFTLLRRNLFVSKKNDTTVPVLAIFAENKSPNEDSLLHITVRRTNKNKEKIYFELDSYDFNKVNKETALSNPYCWKSNLYGGNRVLSILDKYYNSKKITLKKYIESLQIAISQKDTNYTTKLKKTIINGEFPVFQDSNKESIILYSKNKTVLDSFVNNYLQEKSIKIFNNFFIATTSGRQGLRGAYTIIDSDFYNLPYIPNSNIFSFVEQIIINDVVKYRISEFGMGENATINKPINSNNILLEFADIFNQSFNSIYKKGDKEQSLTQIIEGEAFYALEFSYGSKKELKEKTKYKKTENDIEELIQNKFSRNAIVNRVLKIYGENSITLIKPKNLRYWLKSIALRDADEVFEDMINAGY